MHLALQLQVNGGPQKEGIAISFQSILLRPFTFHTQKENHGFDTFFFETKILRSIRCCLALKLGQALGITSPQAKDTKMR